MRISDKKGKLSELISPRRDILRPIYNWHSFKHSYSKDLVDVFIDEFNLKKGSWVMDPFCGGGTTLLACKQAGINSLGLDILPFSVFLSNVKTSNHNIGEIKSLRRKLGDEELPAHSSFSLADVPIATKAFSVPVRNKLLRIRQAIHDLEPANARDFFNLAFLSILESVSNTAKAGAFLRMVERKINPGEVKSIFLSKVDCMIADLAAICQVDRKKEGNASAISGDARKIEGSRLYDAVITSPPYPNRHDYTRIYSLELFFDFVKGQKDLKQIRYDTLRSHVEARKRFDAHGYEEPKKLRNLIERIDKNGTNNSKVLEMLEGYFEDMFLVLSQIRKHLKKRGKVALVVSNVSFAGIRVPVDQLLAEIGEQAGLTTTGVWLARYRGNSSQQMGTYARQPSRESVVIWEN